MSIGIICEGTTDFVILRPIVERICVGHAAVLMQPAKDGLRPDLGGGWQAVRKFLREIAPALDASPHAAFVVHVDADIREIGEIRPIVEEAVRGANAGAERREAEDDLTVLCDHVKSWATGGLSYKAIVVLPREASASWLLAAHTNIKAPEDEKAPDEMLRQRGLVSGKSRPEYEKLAAALLPMLSDRKKLQRLLELQRFVEKLRSARRRF